MNFRQLNSEDLSDFAGNIQTALEGGDLSSLRPDIRAALLAEIGTLPQQLAVLSEEACAAEAARKAKVSERNAIRARLRTIVARTRDSLKASMSSPSEYALCGFKKPGKRGRYIAQSPTTVSAAGPVNGIVKVRFRGNNRYARVVYEIWRRRGGDPTWTFYQSTKRQTFIDRHTIPARNYEYKVRAVAAKTASNFSNVAVLC